MSYEEVITMTQQQIADIWAGFVGSQTPAEFMEISREQGHTTAQEAVAAYVADIPAMFDIEVTPEEAAAITFGLRHYLADHGF